MKRTAKQKRRVAQKKKSSGAGRIRPLREIISESLRCLWRRSLDELPTELAKRVANLTVSNTLSVISLLCCSLGAFLCWLRPNSEAPVSLAPPTTSAPMAPPSSSVAPIAINVRVEKVIFGLARPVPGWGYTDNPPSFTNPGYDNPAPAPQPTGYQGGSTGYSYVGSTSTSAASGWETFGGGVSADNHKWETYSGSALSYCTPSTSAVAPPAAGRKGSVYNYSSYTPTYAYYTPSEAKFDNYGFDTFGGYFDNYGYEASAGRGEG